MAGPNSGYRARLFKALHAEGVKRGLDHDGLHDMVRARCGAQSMSDASDTQLLGIYTEWTHKTLKYRGKLPRRKESPDTEMVSAVDLEDLDQEFAVAGMDAERRAGFIRRQLRGRAVVQTRRDYVRVMGGLRAMRRRTA